MEQATWSRWMVYLNAKPLSITEWPGLLLLFPLPRPDPLHDEDDTRVRRAALEQNAADDDANGPSTD